MRYPLPRDANTLLSWAQDLCRRLEKDYSPIVGGTVTLADSATSTTVAKRGVKPGGRIQLTAASADAASIDTPHVNPEDVDANSFVITHASDLSTDRVFFYEFREG
ncbi:MAG: hypothetical protein OEU92_30925 [Alphaproteobacteria bacterium]|nr:hypothetical protein [Alphaproteobacteria bacterium]